MNLARTSSVRTALLAAGCALALLALPAARADATLQPLADHPAALPLSHSIEKVASKEAPPYVLKLKNTSAKAVTVTAKVLLSVAYHANDKARHVPAHTIEAGQSWSIGELAALDKVILTADGYAELTIEVPAGK